MVGPCLCGDPYCASCGDPHAAAYEEAQIALCEEMDERGMTLGEIDIFKTAGFAAIENEPTDSADAKCPWPCDDMKPNAGRNFCPFCGRDLRY